MQLHPGSLPMTRGGHGPAGCTRERPRHPFRTQEAYYPGLSQGNGQSPAPRRVLQQALRMASLRDSVKVMIGGAPVTEQYAKDAGADLYAPDAASAAQRARQLMQA